MQQIKSILTFSKWRSFPCSIPIFHSGTLHPPTPAPNPTLHPVKTPKPEQLLASSLTVWVGCGVRAGVGACRVWDWSSTSGKLQPQTQRRRPVAPALRSLVPEWPHPTRLETRTKECNMRASLWVVKPRRQQV